jgi:CheY-like chemotaxis protein
VLGIGAGEDILIADDDHANLTAYEAALAPLGRRLVLVHSGVEALARLLDQDFALLLLDVSMPEMTGLETARQIRQRPRNRGLPIIFVTGMAWSTEVVLEAYGAGALDFLTKPVLPEALRAKARVYLQLQERTQALLRESAQLRDAQRRLLEAEAQLRDANRRLLEAEARLRARDAKAPHARPPGARRILIVDDNADAADMLSELLTATGHDVEVARDAEAGLAIAARFAPHVALLDIGLPAIDGYELARRLRLIPVCRTTVLVAVTGYGQPGDRQRSRAAGFAHHLVKPANLATLESLLATVPGDAPPADDVPPTR